MAVHEELVRLAQAAGPGVFDSSDGFRAAFDDFVPEGSTSTGELALLSDAIGTGCFARLLSQLDLGADTTAAVADQARALAAVRGTTETDGAAWALAALAHAVGRIGADQIGPRTLAPPTTSPNDVPGVVPAAPTLPPLHSGPRPPAPPPSRAASARGRVILLAAGAVAAALLSALVLVIVLDRAGSDPSASGGDRATSTDDQGAPPEAVSDDDRSGAVDFAERAAVEVVDNDHERYDAEVDEATALMTEDYAKKYRTTSDGVAADYARDQIVVEAEVAGSGLVGIDPERATVLVFLNQVSTAVGRDPAAVPYRLSLSLVRVDGSWLLDEVMTDAVASEPSEPDTDRRGALDAATATAEAFINFDHRDAEADIAAVLALSTGLFEEQYRASSGSTVTVARENRTVTTGTALGAGLSEFDDDRAVAVVATKGEATSKVTDGRPEARNYRLQLELILVDGKWLTSELTFVNL